jgi:hypothetical protein
MLPPRFYRCGVTEVDRKKWISSLVFMNMNGYPTAQARIARRGWELDRLVRIVWPTSPREADTEIHKGWDPGAVDYTPCRACGTENATEHHPDILRGQKGRPGFTWRCTTDR